MGRTRTNVEIEDDDLRTVMDRYGVHTKTEAVALALRHLAGQPMSREQALAMRGAHAIDTVPDDIATVSDDIGTVSDDIATGPGDVPPGSAR